MNSAVDMAFIAIIISSIFVFGAATKRSQDSMLANASSVETDLEVDHLMDAYSGLVAWASDNESLLLDCMTPSVSGDQDPSSGGPDGTWDFRRFSSEGVYYYATSEVDIPFYSLGRFWGHRKDAPADASAAVPSGARKRGTVVGGKVVLGHQDDLGQMVNPFLYRHGLSGLSEVATRKLVASRFLPRSFFGDVNPLSRAGTGGYGTPSVFYRPCLARDVKPYEDLAVSTGVALDAFYLIPGATQYKVDAEARSSTGSSLPVKHARYWLPPSLWEGGYLPTSFANDAHEATQRNYLNYPKMGVGKSNLVFHATIRFFMPARALDRFREEVASPEAFFHRGLCQEPGTGVDRREHFRACHRKYLLSVLRSGGYDYEILLTAVPSGPPGVGNRGRGEGRMNLIRVRENLREVWKRGDRARLRQRWGYLQAVDMPDDAPEKADAKRILGRSYPGFSWEIGNRAPWFASEDSKAQSAGRYFASNYFLACLRYSSVLSLGARYASYDVGPGRSQDGNRSAYFGRRYPGYVDEYQEQFFPPYFAYDYGFDPGPTGDPFPFLGIHPILPGTISQYRSKLPSSAQEDHLSRLSTTASDKCPAPAAGDGADSQSEGVLECLSNGCFNSSGRRSIQVRSGSFPPIDASDWSLHTEASGASGADYYALGSPVTPVSEREIYETASISSSLEDISLFRTFAHPLYEYRDMNRRLSCGFRRPTNWDSSPPVVVDHFHAFNRACGSPALSAQSIDYIPEGQPDGPGGYSAKDELRRESSISGMWRAYQRHSEAWSEEYAVYAALITRSDVQAYRALELEDVE